MCILRSIDDILNIVHAIPVESWHSIMSVVYFVCQVVRGVRLYCLFTDMYSQNVETIRVEIRLDHVGLTNIHETIDRKSNDEHTAATHQ
jgi:hypothetical protein